MLSDALALIVAIYADRTAQKKSNEMQMTYGYQRAECIGALVNAVFLLALCFTIAMDAIMRFFDSQGVKTALLVLGEWP